MKELKTKYGLVNGITNMKTYRSGHVKSCIVSEENKLSTDVGELIPQYRTAEFGERQKKYSSSLAFFESGQLKSVALEKQMPVQSSLGVYQAEMVTFYEDGGLNRLFPLNGKIDGFWDEKKEGELAEILKFDFSFGTFSSKVIGLHFYPSGELKSLTLWPGETIMIQTPLGEFEVRIGFSLYESGALRSFEPASPIALATPIGEMVAFDPEAMGIHADENSVVFGPEGDLLSLKSVNSAVLARDPLKGQRLFEPYLVPSMMDIDKKTVMPIQVDFSETSIGVTDTEKVELNRDDYEFSVVPRACPMGTSCGSCGDCSGCS